MIRKAKKGDEASIHEAHMRSIREICIHDHGEEEVKGWGNRPLGNRWISEIENGHVWVVELKEAIEGVGCIQISDTEKGKIGYISHLYLTPVAAGKGYGAKLMKLMLDVASDAQVKVIALESSLTALNFYKKYGFKESGPLIKVELGPSMVRAFPMSLSLSST
jgi:GNAT superfamily N-acetyltransferase